MLCSWKPQAEHFIPSKAGSHGQCSKAWVGQTPGSGQGTVAARRGILVASQRECLGLIQYVLSIEDGESKQIKPQ